MTITDPTARLGCHAIRANPDDDHERLMLADVLQELGGVMTCKQCMGRGCKCCSGRRVVPDALAARAELLRVSLDPNVPGRWEGRRFIARRDELVNQYADQWRAGPKCKRCHGKSRSAGCIYCHSTGDAGGLMRKFVYTPMTGLYGSESEPVRVEYHRGMLRITVPTMAECVQEEQCSCRMYGRDGYVLDFKGKWQTCESCKGTGRRTVPTDWLVAVMLHHPDVCEVVALDRVPVSIGSGLWGWYDPARGSASTQECSLPSPIFDLITGAHGGNYNGKLFDTAALAVAALARALAQFAAAQPKKVTTK